MEFMQLEVFYHGACLPPVFPPPEQSIDWATFELYPGKWLELVDRDWGTKEQSFQGEIIEDSLRYQCRSTASSVALREAESNAKEYLEMVQEFARVADVRRFYLKLAKKECSDFLAGELLPSFSPHCFSLYQSVQHFGDRRADR